MIALLRRLAGLGTFVLILPPFAVIAPLTIICWALYWLCTGKDDERILLNPLLDWLTDLPWRAGGWAH
jgi:hypothetical protein